MIAYISAVSSAVNCGKVKDVRRPYFLRYASGTARLQRSIHHGVGHSNLITIAVYYCYVSAVSSAG